MGENLPGSTASLRVGSQPNHGVLMTLTEIAKNAKPGLKFRRVGSLRLFHFDELSASQKKAARLACDSRNNAAPFFSDDMAADDWEVVA